jgi:hypothetical protein
VVIIDGYKDLAEKESALFCAVVNQPISVGIDGSAIDFQLYTGVSLSNLCVSCLVTNFDMKNSEMIQIK